MGACLADSEVQPTMSMDCLLLRVPKSFQYCEHIHLGGASCAQHVIAHLPSCDPECQLGPAAGFRLKESRRPEKRYMPEFLRGGIPSLQPVMQTPV